MVALLPALATLIGILVLRQVPTRSKSPRSHSWSPRSRCTASVGRRGRRARQACCRAARRRRCAGAQSHAGYKRRAGGPRALARRRCGDLPRRGFGDRRRCRDAPAPASGCRSNHPSASWSTSEPPRVRRRCPATAIVSPPPGRPVTGHHAGPSSRSVPILAFSEAWDLDERGDVGPCRRGRPRAALHRSRVDRDRNDVGLRYRGRLSVHAPATNATVTSAPTTNERRMGALAFICLRGERSRLRGLARLRGGLARAR